MIAVSVRRSVSLSVGQSVTRRRVQCVRGNSVQPLPNLFGLLLLFGCDTLVDLEAA